MLGWAAAFLVFAGCGSSDDPLVFGADDFSSGGASTGGSDPVGSGGQNTGMAGKGSGAGSSTGGAAGSKATGGSGGGTGGGTLTVVFLVDRTMGVVWDEQAPEGTPTRWELVRDALLGAGGPVETHQGEVAIGFVGYTGYPGDAASCPNLDLLQVAPALNNLEELRGGFGTTPGVSAEPKAETPTGEALAELAGMLSGASGPKHVVLITDGDPDTCEKPDPQCGHDAAFAAAQAAHAAGITTTVVGVGPEQLDFFDDMAVAGTGQPVRTAASGPDCEDLSEADTTDTGGSADAYVVTDSADLESTFRQILGDLASN